MIGVVVALNLAATPAAPTDFSTRMRESAAGAEALQGPLDGTWTISDAKGFQLYLVQVTDPPAGYGSVAAAWRETGPNARAGVVDKIERRGDLLTLEFAPDKAPTVQIQFRVRGGTPWTGLITQGGRDRPVTLRRAPRAGPEPLPLRAPGR